MRRISCDLQRVNNEAGRQKTKAGCYLYLFPPPHANKRSVDKGASGNRVQSRKTLLTNGAYL